MRRPFTSRLHLVAARIIEPAHRFGHAAEPLEISEERLEELSRLFDLEIQVLDELRVRVAVSRVRKIKFPGVISLRKAFPCDAMPNGNRFLAVSKTFLKFTNIA